MATGPMTAGKEPGGIRGAAAPEEAPPRPQREVTAEAVSWAIRLFLGREPAGPAEIQIHMPHGSMKSLRTAFAESAEFQDFYDTIGKRRKPRFGIPPFLLRPAPEGLPWRFEPPTMEHPVSQLCTAAQFEEPAFAEILEALAMQPRLHRRVWENVFTICVMATEGCIGPGRTALGFGVNRDRIPALLASRGVEVLATAKPTGEAMPPGKEALHLFHPEILQLDDFESLVHFMPFDVADPSEDLGGPYDTLWSTGTVHQLGSVEAGMAFVEMSLELLKPGGVAVHCFDFNLSSNEETVERPNLCIPRRRDVEALLQRLIAAGHEVPPLNLHPGLDAADSELDVKPYGLPHLKVEIARMAVTTLGLVVRRRR